MARLERRSRPIASYRRRRPHFRFVDTEQVSAAWDVLVVGSINLDQTVRVVRPPFRGETVAGLGTVEGPGGKGLNQAVAAARLGLSVGMMASVGGDAAGRDLRQTLDSEGVEVLLAPSPEPTGRAFVQVDDEGDSTITLSPGANVTLEAAWVEAHAARVRSARSVLLQHEVVDEVLESAAVHCRGLLVLNPAPARAVAARVWDRVDVLVPNRRELAQLVGVDDVPEDVEDVAQLARRTGLDVPVIVTLGADGAVVVVPGGTTVHVPAVPASVVDATGAGDTFCAALVDGLLRGLTPVEASGWAVRASAVTVTRPGAALATPRRDELV